MPWNPQAPKPHRSRSTARTPEDQRLSTHTYRLPIVKEQAASLLTDSQQQRGAILGWILTDVNSAPIRQHSHRGKVSGVRLAVFSIS
jgi:hypothetical protein